MRYSFDAPADGPTAKQTQYYEMFGQRGLWHRGWKAVSVHGPVSGIGNFDDDVWELYHADVDRAEAHDWRHSIPRSSSELKALWMGGEGQQGPALNDLQVIGNPKDFETFIGMEFHQRCHRAVSTSTTREPVKCRNGPRPNVHGVSYKRSGRGRPHSRHPGVIFAHGSRFGGHCLFVKERDRHVRVQLPRIPPEDRISAPVPTSGKHVIGCEFTKEGMGPNREGIGPLRLYIDDKQVGEQKIRTVLGHFSLCGEGLCIGYDSADPVSSAYPAAFRVPGRRNSKGGIRYRRRRVHRCREAHASGHGARLTRYSRHEPPARVRLSPLQAVRPFVPDDYSFMGGMSGVYRAGREFRCEHRDSVLRGDRVVSRPRLFEALRSAFADPNDTMSVVLVCAPAGSGKTTFLADWAHRTREEAGAPVVAWGLGRRGTQRTARPPHGTGLALWPARVTPPA